MTARSIRRAIERKAEKQARKENQRQQTSEAQLAANRENALLSTGPKSPEGKAKSSLNAVKTGLTGRTVLLPTDDAEAYDSHVEAFFTELNPADERETELVQRLADTRWRLARIPGLEAGIYALGRINFAENFSQYPAAEAAALIEAHTFLTYQRQLNNLSIQESRLNRQFDRDLKELRQLQADRRAVEQQSAPSLKSHSATAAANGFEFSNGFEISNHLEGSEELSGTPSRLVNYQGHFGKKAA